MAKEHTKGKLIFDRYCRYHRYLNEDDKRIRRQILDGLTDFSATSYSNPQACPQCGGYLSDDPENGLRCNRCDYEDYSDEEERLDAEMDAELDLDSE